MNVFARAATLIVVVTILATPGARPARGTVGLAEWEMATPGGHRISHVDPLKARFGTCLRDPGAGARLIHDTAADVFVAHVEWWTFYRDHVVGKARSGYFIFHEPTKRVELYGDERRLTTEINARRLGTATSRRLTAEDGWRETWAPVYREACERLNTSGAAPSGIDAATHERLKELCASGRWK